MKLQVRTKEIILEPTMCKTMEDGFTLVFRQPTQADVMRMSVINKPYDILEFMSDLLIRFDNKPELENEDGTVIKYETLLEMMENGGEQLTSVLTDVVMEFRTLYTAISEIEKKS